jgi:hypothetical protein
MNRLCLLAGAVLVLETALLGCEPSFERDGSEGEDLPLGDDVDLSASEGVRYPYTMTCKTIPTRTPLTAPRITVSIAGLTLHLTDDATGFSKIYPVGVGAINHHVGEVTSDKSLSLYPVLSKGTQSFKIVTSQVTPCKIWWTDPATGQKSPVFAGLPFLPWYGAYGIHGPVTDYTAANGGRLQRGFVSHGCFRMEAADVAELWAYVRKVSEVPVRVQAAIERDSTGLAVDVSQRWILSECRTDADCNYSGGVCRAGVSSSLGFCSASCTGICSYDVFGYPVTFCASDGKTPAQGYCTNKSSDLNDNCRRHVGFKSASVSRFKQPAVQATVCLPKS